MLDYLAYGLPVITTSCGARGIETDGQEVMFVAAPDDFADTIRQLSVEADVKKRLAEAGRRLVARRYDWQLISRQLQEIILARLRNVHGC